jgi:hypothetical protein
MFNTAPLNKTEAFMVVADTRFVRSCAVLLAITQLAARDGDDLVGLP